MDDPSALLARRTSNSDDTKVRTTKVFVCYNCLTTQSTKHAHEQHIEFCHKNDARKIVLMEPGDKIEFSGKMKADAKMFQSAFMLFYDFEALQVDPKVTCSCPDDVREASNMTEDERAELAMEQHMLEGEVAMEHEVREYVARESGRKIPAKLGRSQEAQRKRGRVKVRLGEAKVLYLFIKK